MLLLKNVIKLWLNNSQFLTEIRWYWPNLNQLSHWNLTGQLVIFRKVSIFSYFRRLNFGPDLFKKLILEFFLHKYLQKDVPHNFNSFFLTKVILSLTSWNLNSLPVLSTWTLGQVTLINFWTTFFLFSSDLSLLFFKYFPKS